MAFLSPERTISRKIKEAILAAEISRRWSKDEILEFYLNELYYGNLAYGLLATDGILPGWIANSRPYILAGSLPILVLFLSELLSDDRQHATAQAAKEAKRAAKQATFSANDTIPDTFIPGDPGALNKANDTRQAKIEARRSQVLTMLGEGHTQAQIAESLGVSLETIKRDTKALNGQFKGVSS